ncbi:MAG: hypothetical protein IJV41_09685 [Oscillospiraceae bacterium]|nr:hypothetical protein [Oscillospiraceae bacterium]
MADYRLPPCYAFSRENEHTVPDVLISSCFPSSANAFILMTLSPSLVFFSAAFREQLWKLLAEGKTPQEAVEMLGIDPKILGKT